MLLSLWEISLETLSFKNTMIILVFGSFLGLLLSLEYIITHRKEAYDHSFTATILVLPVISSVIIVLVSSNVARALSLAGVFTLIRFRTAISNTKDVTYIFSTVAIGLSLGLGYLGYALLITIFFVVLFLLISVTKLDYNKSKYARLDIYIPESLNFTNVFDEVFKEFLDYYSLEKIKTVEFGEMFKLSYIILLKKDVDTKKFLDELRVLNGNLNIALKNNYDKKIGEAIENHIAFFENIFTFFTTY